MNVLIYHPTIPGNLGNVVRTAQGYEVHDFHIYDPNWSESNKPEFMERAITVSAGAWIKVQPKFIANESELERFMENYNGKKIATVCNGKNATWLYHLRCEPNDLIMLGNEKEGLPKEIIEAADLRITIPINSHSLNIGAAFSAIGYEYRRQAYVEHMSKKKK